MKGCLLDPVCEVRDEKETCFKCCASGDEYVFDENLQPEEYGRMIETLNSMVNDARYRFGEILDAANGF